MKESCKNIDLKRREREKYSVHTKKKKKKEIFNWCEIFILYYFEKGENIISKNIRRWKDCIIIFIEFQMFFFRVNLWAFYIIIQW